MLTKQISLSIEQNQHDFLESQIQLKEVVKKDGKMLLEPKYKEPDTFMTRIKSGKQFLFCVKIAELHKSTVTIKFELRSFDEMRMQFKLNSQSEKQLAGKLSMEVKHLAIPFQVCLSTVNEKPNPFTDELYNFDDSNMITYKVPKYTADQYMFL